MDACKLNLSGKMAQRDPWSDLETEFFVRRYNLYADDVGKHKKFKTKKDMFSCIAGEMAIILNSKKTVEQINSRFTMTRKQSSSVVSGIVDDERATNVDNLTEALEVELNDGTAVVDLSEATLINTDEFEVIGPSGTELTGQIKAPMNVGIATVYNSTTGSSLNNISSSTNASMNERPIMRITEVTTGFEETDSVTPNSNAASAGALSTALSTPSPSHALSRSTELRIVENSRTLGGSTDKWTNRETKWLLDQYIYYADEVGPMKIYRTKNDLWKHLSQVMNDLFDCDKTAGELSKRVDYVISLKKKAVNQNRTSGATRLEIEFEDEINKIAAMDDSIEPEVLRCTNYVQYKDKTKEKETEGPPSKTPRWGKPNKKAILNTISQTMLSIETRRVQREKQKEVRRGKIHEELLELIRSQKQNKK